MIANTTKRIYSGRQAKPEPERDFDLMAQVNNDLTKSKTQAQFQKNMAIARQQLKEKRAAERAKKSSNINNQLATKSTNVKNMTKGQRFNRLRKLKGELLNNPVGYAKHMPWLAQ